MTDPVHAGIFDWVKGQPFNNVLIATLLGMLSWLGWYGLTSAIPEHIKTIQSGYERIEAVHNTQRTTDRDDHRAALKQQQEVFKETLDRITEHQHKPATTAAN